MFSVLCRFRLSLISFSFVINFELKCFLLDRSITFGFFALTIFDLMGDIWSWCIGDVLMIVGCKISSCDGFRFELPLALLDCLLLWYSVAHRFVVSISMSLSMFKLFVALFDNEILIDVLDVVWFSRLKFHWKYGTNEVEWASSNNFVTVVFYRMKAIFVVVWKPMNVPTTSFLKIFCLIVWLNAILQQMVHQCWLFFWFAENFPRWLIRCINWKVVVEENCMTKGKVQ